jgi:hypothetical protein
MKQNTPFLQNTQKTKLCKRNAVRDTYNKLLELFGKFHVTHEKRVFGKELIRICCRTFEQLRDIDSRMKIILEANLVAEIGLPIEYKYKMKTLVIYIKPIDTKSKIKIRDVFKNSTVAYPIVQKQTPTSNNSDESKNARRSSSNIILTQVNECINLMLLILFLFFIRHQFHQITELH